MGVYLGCHVRPPHRYCSNVSTRLQGTFQTNLQVADVSNHMREQSVTGNIERNSKTLNEATTTRISRRQMPFETMAASACSLLAFISRDYKNLWKKLWTFQSIISHFTTYPLRKVLILYYHWRHGKWDMSLRWHKVVSIIVSCQQYVIP